MPSISYSGRRTSRDSATSSSRGSQPHRRWIAFNAGIRLGPGNLPARASVPGKRGWTGMPGRRPLLLPPPVVASVAMALDPLANRGRLVHRRTADLLDLDRAELELRDLAHGVDLVDRQQVRRRLAEVERHEARARRVAVGQPRARLDRAAPGAQADEVAVGDAHRLRVVGVHVDVRLGLDGVERVRAPRHRAGVPVLEQAARVEDEWVLLGRQLLGRHPLGAHEVGLAVVGAEALVEQHDSAVAVLRVRVRVELAGRAEVVVLQARVVGHDRHELVEDLARVVVVHRQADAVAHLLDDLPVLARLARRVEHLAPELHAAVGVRVRAVLLEVRGRGQDHVGELGRLGQEDVLDDEELEGRERLADLVDVRVRQERVLAHHVHAAHAALERGGDDLGDRQALVRVERDAPRLLEALAHAGRVDRLVVRIHHRDQAGVGRALHVVLAAQRVQSRAGPADVAGDRAHRDQAARVVGARRVLGDPHAPVDDTRVRLAPQAGDEPDRVGVDSGDLLGALRRVLLDDLRDLAVVGRARGDEVAVDQAEADDLVHDAVVEGDVGAGLDLAVDVGVVGDPLAARVDDDQLRPAAPGLLEERRRDRVVGRRVRAREDRDVGVEDVAVGRRDRAGADALEQRRDARGVAQARAVVDVVRPEAGADELLEKVGLLVGALRRAEAGDRRRAVRRVDLLQAARGELERLLPRRLAEVGEDLVVVDEPARLALLVGLAAHVLRERPLRIARLAADERGREALGRGGVVPAVAALHAQAALVARLLAALGERDRLELVVDVEGQRAADAAVRAHGVDLAQLGARPDRDVADRLVRQRAGRARGDALAARDARRLAHRVVEVERDPRRVALARAPDDVVALDVVAGADAAVAEDARVVVDGDDGVRVVLAPAAAARQDALLLRHVVLADVDQQLVVRGLRLLGVLLDRRLVDVEQLRELRPVALELRRVGADLHVVLARAHARGGVDAGADVDDAHAADADGVVALVVAQDRDLDALVLGGLPDRRALGNADLAAVDREADGADLGGGGGGDGHDCLSVSWIGTGVRLYGTARILGVQCTSASSRRSSICSVVGSPDGARPRAS